MVFMYAFYFMVEIQILTLWFYNIIHPEDFLDE